MLKRIFFVMIAATAASVASADLLSPAAVIDHGTLHAPVDDPTFGLANVVDENLSTFTVLEDEDGEDANGAQNFLAFDLGSEATISAVQIHPRQPHGGRSISPTLTEVFRFDGDDPGGSRISVGTVEFDGLIVTDPDPEGFSEKDFPAITVRYVGLNFLAGGDAAHVPTNTQFSEIYFSTPEPGTAALAGFGLVGALGLLRRRPKRA